MSKTIKVALAGAGAFGIKHLDGIKTVSYTHLTLPTSDLV